MSNIVKINCLVNGIITCIMLTSLFQDYLGKIEYIRLIETYWIDAKISVPIAVAVLVLIIGDFVKDLRHE